MRAVVQRVKKGNVTVDNEVKGEIGEGLAVFIGVGLEDDIKDLEYMTEKIVNLRVFEDQEGKMNYSVKEITGEILVISQFTLFGDCRKGRRPNFTKAKKPDEAEILYDEFCTCLRNTGVEVSTGVFQAMMDVNLVIDGPVTLLLDSKKAF